MSYTLRVLARIKRAPALEDLGMLSVKPGFLLGPVNGPDPLTGGDIP
jgi:hypothetical protein